MRVRTVCILGGTGFVGRHIANRLAERKIEMRVLTRNRERNRQALLIFPTLQLIQADAHDENCLLEHFRGCDAVINLVGILNESGGPRGAQFRRAHVELPEKIIGACRKARVPRLLHMSALGADPQGPSLYQKTKGEGERLALEANDRNLAVTAFRPSVIFGPEDDFLNRFERLLRMSIGFFPLPTPGARFSPVYVGDVAEAFARSLDDKSTFGRSYELCGPETRTLEELVRRVGEISDHQRRILPMGDGMSRFQARILERFPGKPYSYDNYLSSTVDNVCSRNALPDFGIHPTAIDAVVPGYMGNAYVRRRYNTYRRLARRD